MSRIKIACFTLASTCLVAAAEPIPAEKVYNVPLSGHAETNFAHPAGGTGDLDGSGEVTIGIYPI